MSSSTTGVWSLGKRQREAIRKRRATIEQIRSDPRFEAGLLRIVAEEKLEEESAREQAGNYLNELVSVHSSALPDFSLLLARIFDRRGFKDVVQYDEASLKGLQALNAKSPLAFLIAHRSYMDFVARLPFAWHDFEREFRFAGANTMVGPVSTFGHNVGMIYVRRGFRDPVYTFSLRQYVGWLAERNSSFLWPIEGTRTRTGKTLQPKMGILAYLADAYIHGHAPDIPLVPIALSYEYLHEVYEYANYGRGASKQAETVWLSIRLIREQRRVPAEARIYIGIGEPIYLSNFVDRFDPQPAGVDVHAEVLEEKAIAEGIRGAATEVCRRIDAVTPITAVALVLLPLLEHGRVRMTLDEMVQDLEPTVRYISKHKLPAPEPGLGCRPSLQRALRLLCHQGLVTAEGSPEAACYSIASNQHIEAAYYRNSIVHFFAAPSIVEVALVRTARFDSGEALKRFWSESARLRAVFEYEFFFAGGDQFEQSVHASMASLDPNWESVLEQPGGAAKLLNQIEKPFAPRSIAPFIEAYRSIANGLLRLEGDAVANEECFTRECLAQAQDDLAAGRLFRPDAASLNMYDTALLLARARDLLGEQADEGRSRERFTAEINDIWHCIRTLEEQANNA